MAKFKRTDNLYEYNDIEVFEMVRSGALHSFPIKFWDGHNAKDIAKELTKYLFENILKWTIEDIKNKPLSEIFYDNRLGSMIKNVFEGSTIKAIINAYPELEEWFTKEEKEEEVIHRTQYTDEELIENLKLIALELKRNPRMREMKNPEGTVYYNRFGSWTKALIAAELIDDIYKDVDYSKEEETKNIIKEFVIEHERIPSKEEVLDLISEGELNSFFRSYSGLCDYLESEYTKEELIKIVKNKAKKLNRLPLSKDMIIPRGIVFVDAFGSWDNCLKEAGLK